MKNTQNISLAVDAVVFGYEKNIGLSILLVKRKFSPFKHDWALPGGYVKDDESLEQAVLRELEEESGVKLNYMEQLFSFGDVNRDPRQRVVSISYLGLIRQHDFILHASTDAEDVAWFNVKELPKLAFDHTEIIQMGLQRLKGKATYAPIGFELLNEKFPFSDLERLYSILLDKEIDRRNFKKKLMKFGFIEELDELAKIDSAGRPGKYFTFNKKRYNELQMVGFGFEL